VALVAVVLAPAEKVAALWQETAQLSAEPVERLAVALAEVLRLAGKPPGSLWMVRPLPAEALQRDGLQSFYHRNDCHVLPGYG
jgi:hypothetical protein